MNSNLKDNIVYRGRFLFLYLIFGCIALIIEFSLRNFFLKLNLDDNYATAIGIVAGIFFAYWSNIKFNFQIPTHRLKKVFYFFFMISIFSKVLQTALVENSNFENLNYIPQRIISSGFVFILIYLINLRITFNSRTKIGIAIYANNDEDIEIIYNKIGKKPDFIQVDIVDETIDKKANIYNLEVIQGINEYWPEKPIELHIMSLEPEKIINELGDLIHHIDLFLIHEDCEKEFEKIHYLIKKMNKDFGIFYKNNAEILKIKNYSHICDQITIMGIKKLGQSGQKFIETTYTIIDKIEKFENRSDFKLEIDGGINSSNFFKLKVDKIVSASAILDSNNPVMKILEFKRM